MSATTLPSFQSFTHDLTLLEEHDQAVLSRLSGALVAAAEVKGADAEIAALIQGLVRKAQAQVLADYRLGWLERYA